MALESSTTSILEDGVLFFEDPDIGRRVDEFDKKGFPFQTEEGLDFCRKSTLDDTASSDHPFCKCTISWVVAYPRCDRVILRTVKLRIA